MKKLIALLIFLHCIFVTFAQPFSKLLTASDKQLSFSRQSEKINKFFDTATGQNRSCYKQWKREEWFASQHLSAGGSLENYAAKNFSVNAALRATNNSLISPTNNYGAWYNLGHTNATVANFSLQGRVNCFAFDPVSPAIIYAGAAGGGIWKSSNYGASWQSITDNLPLLGISSIAVDPTNRNIIYAITGDGNGPNAFSHRGFGIIKTYDAGSTWIKLSLSSDETDVTNGGYKLLIDPNNHNNIFAAMKSGLWKSADAGDSWTQIAYGNITDIEFKPGNNNILYYTALYDAQLHTLNVTTNQTTHKTLNLAMPVTRMEIAVTAANPNAIFILAGPSSSSPAGCPVGSTPIYNGLFYSPDAGTTFNLRNSNLDIFGMCRDQSTYDIAIFVSPSNENIVLIAGIRCYVSNNGGVNFSLANDPTNSVSHDCHAIEKNPLVNDIYVGNDGGVHRSTNNGASWSTASDGLVINEYHRLSAYQGNTNLVLGGTQDNGLLIKNSSSSVFYSPNILLDFMDNIIDHTNSNIMYACSQNGGLNKSINAGLSFFGISMPTGTFGNWITPIIQSPTAGTSNTIYYGANSGILRSTNGGSTWANIGGQIFSECLGIGTDGFNFSLYSSNGSFMSRCDNPLAGSPVWTNLTSPNMSNISAIAVNPANKNEVWICCSGYQAGDKVFRTTNAGATWSNLSLSLPNIPIYSIVFANNTNSPSGAVYIGTELGVYYTDDLIPDWEPYYNGLPMVPVVDLFMDYTNAALTAATFGRGIWRSEAYNSCPGSYSITGSVFGKKFYQTSGNIDSYQIVPGSAGNELRLRGTVQVTLKDGFKAYNGSYLHAAIGPCGSGVISKVAVNDSLQDKKIKE